MNRVGSKIRKTREERGITQEYMAIELEISQSSYGRLEKDDRRLTVPKILKIANVLEVTIAYLFEENTTKYIQQNQSDSKQSLFSSISSDKAHIKSLKEEIEFLRKMLHIKSLK